MAIKPQCPWRKPKKHPMDRADRIANTVVGGLFGLAVLLVNGLVILLAFVKGAPPHAIYYIGGFAGILISLFALLGYLFGDPFLDYMRDNLHRFVGRHHGDG